MPTFTQTTKEPIQVQHLNARCGVRYWEDATVNGEVDEDGSRIPLRDGDNWCIKVDLETGIICDWPPGVTASVHYKVCDDGTYFLSDENGLEFEKFDWYVPPILSPEENGFGDYVILEIDGGGKIRGWKCDLSYFEEAHEPR